MTPTELNSAIAKSLGHAKFVGLKKRGLWYRPNAAGYTSNESEAGRYTWEEAKDHEYPVGDEPVTIHEFTTPNYSGSLDAMAKAEAALTDEEHRLFRSHLVDWILSHKRKNRDYLSSPALQRATAWAKTRGVYCDSH